MWMFDFAFFSRLIILIKFMKHLTEGLLCLRSKYASCFLLRSLFSHIFNLKDIFQEKRLRKIKGKKYDFITTKYWVLFLISGYFRF